MSSWKECLWWQCWTSLPRKQKVETQKSMMAITPRLLSCCLVLKSPLSLSLIPPSPNSPNSPHSHPQSLSLSGLVGVRHLCLPKSHLSRSLPTNWGRQHLSSYTQYTQVSSNATTIQEDWPQRTKVYGNRIHCHWLLNGIGLGYWGTYKTGFFFAITYKWQPASVQWGRQINDKANIMYTSQLPLMKSLRREKKFLFQDLSKREAMNRHTDHQGLARQKAQKGMIGPCGYCVQ